MILCSLSVNYFKTFLLRDFKYFFPNQSNILCKTIRSFVVKYRIFKCYSFKMAGEVERLAETFGGLGTIIIIMIFGIIAILILEFKTLF